MPWRGNGYPLSILAWKIWWTEEPGRLQSMGSQRVRHDWGHSETFPFYSTFPQPLDLWIHLLYWYILNKSSQEKSTLHKLCSDYGILSHFYVFSCIVTLFFCIDFHILSAWWMINELINIYWVITHKLSEREVKLDTLNSLLLWDTETKTYLIHIKLT